VKFRKLPLLGVTIEKESSQEVVQELWI